MQEKKKPSPKLIHKSVSEKEVGFNSKGFLNTKFTGFILQIEVLKKHYVV